MANANNELILARIVNRWRVYIDYKRLNKVTCEDHSLPFLTLLLLKWLFEIQPNYNEDHEKTTFMCPYGIFVFIRMSFWFCNALATFQRCMMTIFTYMVEAFMETFMYFFSVYGIIIWSLFVQIGEGSTKVVLQSCIPVLQTWDFTSIYLKAYTFKNFGEASEFSCPNQITNLTP